MPVYTFSHCLFCFRKDNNSNVTSASAARSCGGTNSGQGKDDSSTSSVNTNAGGTRPPPAPAPDPHLTAKKEVCRRFCILATRYLDIDPYHYHPDKTICSKYNINTDRVCDHCYPALKSFCEIYESWKYLQLQLDHRIMEISNIIKLGEVENVGLKEALLKQMEEIGETPNDLEDFRTEFVSGAARLNQENFPRLPMVCKEMQEDPDFQIVKIIPKKKKCVSEHDPSLLQSEVKMERESPLPPDSPPPPLAFDDFEDNNTEPPAPSPNPILQELEASDRKRRRKNSQSSDDSMFAVIHVKKKKKRSKSKDKRRDKDKTSSKDKMHRDHHKKSKESKVRDNGSEEVTVVEEREGRGSSKSTEVIELSSGSGTEENYKVTKKVRKKHHGGRGRGRKPKN